MLKTINKIFDLTGKVTIITGGAGLLGVQHSEAIATAGGIPIIVDINEKKCIKNARIISQKYNIDSIGIKADVTKKIDIEEMLDIIIQKFGRVDILINNATNDPKISEHGFDGNWMQFEEFPLEEWHEDLNVNLTGAFLCSQIFGREIIRRKKKGVILNIASDLSVVVPNQKIYRKEGIPEKQQSVKPVTYPVFKFGLIGLTKYLAVYWAEKGIRVNALSPSCVFNNQPPEIICKIESLIPMNRMSKVDEYWGAIIFLCSDASSYMTGANVIIDGGRTCW